MKFKKVLLLVLSLALVNFSFVPHFSSSAARLRVVNLGEHRYTAEDTFATPPTEEQWKSVKSGWEHVRDSLQDKIVGEDGKTTYQTKGTVGFGESATAGLAMVTATSIIGGASIFRSSYVTYNNDAKEKLGVDKSLLDGTFYDEEYGHNRGREETPEVACAMAQAAANFHGTTFGIGYTGSSTERVDYAIYDGRDPDNPVVYHERVHLPSWRVGGERVANNYLLIKRSQDIFLGILNGEIGTAGISEEAAADYDDSTDDSVSLEDLFGEPEEFGGHTQYVDKDGVTRIEYSAENADENGIIWLQEESEGTSNVYGIEYIADLFEEGSTFHVEWVDEDSDDFSDLMKIFDDTHEDNVEANKMTVFNMGVTSPDGTEYSDINGTANIVIAHGEDWDDGDIKAVHPVDGGIDEQIQVTETKTMHTPDGNLEVSKIAVTHFSPYVIFDAVDTPSPMLYWAIGGIGALAILFVIWQVRKAKASQASA